MACRLIGTKPLSEPCRNIVNWTPGNNFQLNFNSKSYIFIQENVFENVVCQMAAILSRRQCVKSDKLYESHVTYYSDVTWVLWCQKSPATRLFLQPILKADIKENIKAPHYWLFVKRSTGSPRKGSAMWKAFQCHDVMDVIFSGISGTLRTYKISWTMWLTVIES